MMSETIKITSPLQESDTTRLKAGDAVLISGTIYVARDAAHRRIVDSLDKGEKPPFDIQGQTVYYMGPSPARPGQVIGSAGPTSSYRMDSLTPRMIDEGLKGMIGKGERSPEVKEAIVKHKVVYFVATGGAAALITKSIKKSELVAYEDLGAEAVLKLTVEDFPAIVANDIYGGDIFRQNKPLYRQGE